MLRRFIPLFVLLFIADLAISQVAYVVPKEADINSEITVYVNVTHPDCNCPNLQNSPGDVYMWTWKPSDPVAGNGQWNASNEDLKMTDEGNGLYSIKFIPSQFYTITDVELFYSEDIHFLAKLKDGGSGGGTDKENKSGDLVAEIDPVPGCEEKICPFPVNFGQDDYFTVKYDNNKEEKASMKSLADGDVYLFARCVANGVVYEVTPFNDVANNPDLQMKAEGNGIFTLTFIPEDFFPIPSGDEITSMIFVVRRKVFNGPDDKTDGTSVIAVGCN